MNWKQQLAEYLGYKSFEEMDTSDQRTAEKAIEFYKNEVNEFFDKFKYQLEIIVDEKQNDGNGVPGIPENPIGQTIAKSEERDPWVPDYDKMWIDLKKEQGG